MGFELWEGGNSLTIQGEMPAISVGDPAIDDIIYRKFILPHVDDSDARTPTRYKVTIEALDE